MDVMKCLNDYCRAQSVHVIHISNMYEGITTNKVCLYMNLCAVSCVNNYVDLYVTSLFPCKQSLGVYRNLPVRLSRENITLVVTFEQIKIGLPYNTCMFLLARPFYLYQKNFIL